MYKAGNPTGDVTVSIRLGGGGGSPHKPQGSDLCSGSISATTIGTSIAWYEWSQSPEYTLTSGTQYCIVTRMAGGDSSNRVNTICYNGTSNYPDGQMAYSNDGGANWTVYGNDYSFSVWCNPPPVPPTVTTQAATSIGLD